MEFGNKTLQNQTIKNKSTRESNCLPPSTNKLKVMLSNADTLTNKLTELDFIVSQENPHIIAINEVMPKNAKREIYREEFHITGYEMITDPNVVNNTGRGSLIYLHNSLTSKQVFFPIDGENFSKGVFCEINFKDKEKLLCALFYRRGESCESNNRLLLDTLKQISEKNYSHLLVLGDFNLPDIDWEFWTTSSNTDSFEKKFIECIRDCFLFQHITEYTRQRGNDRPSTLDLVFTISLMKTT